MQVSEPTGRKRSTSRLRNNAWLLAGACGLGLVAAMSQDVSAGAISASDLVVYQQGNFNGTTGTATSGNLGVPISILEITPTGTLVQTIPIPSASLVTDSSGSEGGLSLSDNGTLLSFTGYTGGSVSNETNNAGRAVGALDSTGTFNTPAGASYSNATTNTQTRAAYSGDGSNWYMTDKSGIYYNGATSILGGSSNTRTIKNFGGVTYILQATAGTAVVSSLTPSSPGSGATSVTVTPVADTAGNANAVDFAFASSGKNGATYDTLYFADNTGIFKYALVGGTWTQQGTAITSVGTKVNDLTVVPDATAGFDIYYTSNVSSANVLDEVTDSAAYNAAPSPSAISILYTAPAGDLLKGVSFGPTATPEPSTVMILAGGGLFGLLRRRRAARRIR